jgi:Ser/Thr protein kinase RdoA (MazF antagonist)
MSSVLCLRDANGGLWFVKHHRDRSRYRAELAAYRAWVPAVQEAAPRLRAHDDELPALLLSAVPGAMAPWPAGEVRGPVAERSAERAVHREAGKVLRRLHDAAPALPWPGFSTAKIEEFDRLRPAAAQLLTPRELGRAAAEIAGLAAISVAPVRVPCHHDYTPRNWVIDHGALHVVDFEWCGLDAWVADLARLYLGIWPGRPDLREEFLAGYGRELSRIEREMLRGCAVLTGVWLVVKAHETGRPSFEDRCRTALLGALDRLAGSGH